MDVLKPASPVLLRHMKSEQPETTPKSPVDVFDLIFDTTKCYTIDF